MFQQCPILAFQYLEPEVYFFLVINYKTISFGIFFNIFFLTNSLNKCYCFKYICPHLDFTKLSLYCPQISAYRVQLVTFAFFIRQPCGHFTVQVAIFLGCILLSLKLIGPKIIKKKKKHQILARMLHLEKLLIAIILIWNLLYLITCLFVKVTFSEFVVLVWSSWQTHIHIYKWRHLKAPFQISFRREKLTFLLRNRVANICNVSVESLHKHGRKFFWYHSLLIVGVKM